MEHDLQNFINSLFQERIPEEIVGDKVHGITHHLTKNRYRKRKLTKGMWEFVEKPVKHVVQNDAPLWITIPFGAFKQFRSPNAPHTNWAEVFHLAYMREYLAPIAASHEPGIVVEYCSEGALILTMMDNYPPEALGTYEQEFCRMLEELNKKCPSNIEFRFRGMDTLCDVKRLRKEVAEKLPARMEQYGRDFRDKEDDGLKRSYRSIMWDGYEDLTGLTEDEREKRILQSRVIEILYIELFEELTSHPDYYVRPESLLLLFTWGLSSDNDFDGLTIGSVRSSVVDFWIGSGILEIRENGKLVPRVVSPGQYEKIAEELTYKKVASPLGFPGFELPVYEGALRW